MDANIIGSGACLPDRVVTNEELAETLALKPERIFKSSGIKRRRWADPETPVSALAASALQGAIADANIDAQQIGYLIFGTTPLAVLRGDCPSALIVSGEPKPGAIEIIDVYLATDGAYADELGIRRPGTEFGTTNSPNQNPGDSWPRMNGQSVILHASRRIVAACRTLLERHKLSSRDIRWIVPHQANANLLAPIAHGLKFTTADG